MSDVNQHGISIVEDFVSDTKSLIASFDSVFDSIPTSKQYEHSESLKDIGDYKNGKFLRIFPNAYHEYADLVTVYQTSFFRSIASSFYKCPHEFGKQFFLSHEYIVQPTSELPRNAYMHMDPYQALKFIIYLTDTTKENGAFRYVPNTVRLGRALREEFCKDDEGRRDAYRVDYHKFITYSDEDVKYCEASLDH